ncbi:orotate phosphoribosyltransferase [Youxingia wuxianensis]|uniref:Orotate phosphoribosyltransferase n=1 Tax=Youxingia wuxianensis TaxID=2763678 RepID=A0A926EPI3_9FIRM|nr:orotate phosphoribosyltransferase [Youxingia wuxianensis]MBC8586406.1 orotate phosphoribosyltransferase [Youxingia wuxianensis]
MESRTIKIKSKVNSKVSIAIIPGHFATNHSHVNYYIDMTGIKYRHKQAHLVADSLAAEYTNSTPVDTIVCMDDCEMIGAFLARELSKPGVMSMNSDNDIAVITPQFNTNAQLIFRDNIQNLLWNKHIILLVASATTGKTINRALECIRYYGGNVVGISAIFSAIDMVGDIPVRSLFSARDLPDYQTWALKDCPFCKKQEGIDAIVDSYGYTRL